MDADGGPDHGAAQRWPRALAASRPSRGRRTLARLLDAAVGEFSAHGYRGARVSQVAKVAGTSHGTFYVYFEDKADLLVATLDDVRADLDEVLLAPPALLPGPAGLPLLEGWLRPVCARLQRHAGVLAALTDAVIDGDDSRPPATGRPRDGGGVDRPAGRAHRGHRRGGPGPRHRGRVPGAPAHRGQPRHVDRRARRHRGDPPLGARRGRPALPLRPRRHGGARPTPPRAAPEHVANAPGAASGRHSEVTSRRMSSFAARRAARMAATTPAMPPARR